MNLPKTIVLDFQPYSVETLGDLHWDTETYTDWNNGRQQCERTVLRGTVIEGYQRARLCGHTTRRDTKGEPRTISNVKPYELDRRLIVRVAM